jgi:hypothetical protein
MREAFAGERSGLLEALGGTGRRLSAVFAFKSSRAVDIRRLKVQAVCADMAGVCRQLRKRL